MKSLNSFPSTFFFLFLISYLFLIFVYRVVWRLNSLIDERSIIFVRMKNLNLSFFSFSFFLFFFGRNWLNAAGDQDIFLDCVAGIKVGISWETKDGTKKTEYSPRQSRIFNKRANIYVDVLPRDSLDSVINT